MTELFKDSEENYKPTDKANVAKPALPTVELPTNGPMIVGIFQNGEEGEAGESGIPPYATRESDGIIRLDSTLKVGSNLPPVIEHVDGRHCIRVKPHYTGGVAVTSLPAILSTSSTSATSADGSDADGTAVDHGTGAVLGNQTNIAAAWLTSGVCWQIRHKLYMQFIFKVSSFANVRFWAGLSDAVATTMVGSVITTLANNFIGFSYDTAVPDAGLQFAVNDGGTASKTLVADSLTANAYNMFEIFTDSGEVHYRVNRGETFSVTTDIPAASTVMNEIAMGVKTLTADAKTFKSYQMYISSY